MATTVQLRRGNTTQTAAFTGAVAEITVDTDKGTVVVHNGVTAGGHALALDSKAQAAFDAANAAGSSAVVTAAFDHANAAYLAANNGGIDITNLTSQLANDEVFITNVNATQNNNITVLSLVNDTQNTNIQAAFDAANSATVSGNIVVDSVTSNTYVSIPYAIMTTSLSYANTASSNTLVDNFDTTIFRGAKYNIQVTSDSGYQISELSLIQNNSDVIISEYGVVCSNTSVASLGTFYANVQSGIVNLNFNGIDANNTLVLYKVGMANTGISGSSGGGGTTLPGDLMTGSGTIDLLSTSGTIDLN